MNSLNFQPLDKFLVIAVSDTFLEALYAPTCRNFPAVFGQSKIKGGTLVHLPFRQDSATVMVDNALDDGQTDAGAFILPAAID